jgi:hypothetical protein
VLLLRVVLNNAKRIYPKISLSNHGYEINRIGDSGWDIFENFVQTVRFV